MSQVVEVRGRSSHLPLFVSASSSKAKFLWTFLLRLRCGCEEMRRCCHLYKSVSGKNLQRRDAVTDDKMKALTRSIILSVFLQICSQNPINYWTLLPNILVVEVNGSEGTQPLSCLGSLEDGTRRDNESEDLFWRNNGVEEEQRGNSYLVQLEESLGGGNYSCHRKDGSLVNYTVVLIQEHETKRRKILLKTDEDYLKCSARNYNGEFHCSWTWHRNRVSKVAFIEAWRVSDNVDSHCSLDATVQRWTCSSGQSSLSCMVDESGNSISCVDEQHCPYAEESQQIYVNIYVRTEHFLLENYSKQFFLSDIVKPDKVRITKVNTTAVEWSYPSSWSSPSSYFPLTFQIALLKRGCKRCVNPCSKAAKNLAVYSTDICQFKFKHKAKMVCVRAKDALCNSHWSEWSHLRLRRGRQRKRVRHQQTKSLE